MSMRLEGKRALVIGGGQSGEGEPVGIGRATAIQFAREGAIVTIADANLESAEGTAAIIRGEGGTAFTREADIRSEVAVEALAAAAAKSMGGIDILQNNVGAAAYEGVPDKDMLELDVDTFTGIIDLNLKGMWLTCKHVVPIMRAQGHGVITNISSISSVMGGRYDDYAAYRISKGGVNVLTNILAMQNGRYGIRANALLVGPIETAGSHINNDLRGLDRNERRKSMIAGAPLDQRPGSGWDVAFASVFLGSDEASFITGANLPVDGGLSARVR